MLGWGVVRLSSLRFLVGPTAVGKTDLALRLAGELGAEIICCDALLVYRKLDIGTAKPTCFQLQAVPHHLLDLVGLDRLFSVADYFEEVRRCLEGIFSRGKRVLVVGGSTFYLRGYFEAVVSSLPRQGAVVERVAALEREGGLAALWQALLDLHGGNSEEVVGVDSCNAQRVAKALERCLQTGKTLVELQADFRRQVSGFEGFERLLVRVDRPDEVLKARIVQRTKAMLERGLLEETRALFAEGLREHKTACKAVGYRQVLRYLKQGGRREDLEADICQATWQLVQRQRRALAKHVAGPSIDLGSGEGAVEAWKDFRACQL